MTRIFQFQGIRLPDPNPTMSVDGELKALCSLTNSRLRRVGNGPERRTVEAAYVRHEVCTQSSIDK